MQQNNDIIKIKTIKASSSEPPHVQLKRKVPTHFPSILLIENVENIILHF